MTDPLIAEPPYAPPGYADRLFNTFKKQIPKIIDSKFVVDNKIATKPNASYAINLAKWLGLITSTGEIDEEKTVKMSLVGEELNKHLTQLIKGSYRDLFQNLDLETATEAQIVNYFVNKYRFSHRKAKDGTKNREV